MNSQNQYGSLKHLYTLDILRGLASLSIVLWHYQNFFFVAPGELASNFVRSSLPMYFLFWPFYERGPLAVALFFVLSGFVFYFVYCDSVRAKRMSAYEFVVLRLSRLYPLYFVTLIFVAVMQIAAHHATGKFIIYPYNDLYHFVLNLFFASSWGLERGWSFNSPTWSVSVEVVLYAGFFVVASVAGRSLVSALTTALAGALAGLFFASQEHGSLAVIGQGFSCFFAGGGAFMVQDRLSGKIPLVDFVGFICGAGNQRNGISCIPLHALPLNSLVSREVLIGVCFPASM